MGNDGGNPLFVGVGGELFIVEKCCLSIRDQTPVLHSTSIEVWKSYLICIRKEIICCSLCPTCQVYHNLNKVLTTLFLQLNTGVRIKNEKFKGAVTGDALYELVKKEHNSNQ